MTTEAIEEYWAIARTLARKPEKVDVKYLQLRTAETHIMDFCSKKEIAFREEKWATIKFNMIRNGYSFVDIQDKRLRLLINEMAIRYQEGYDDLIVTEDISEHHKHHVEKTMSNMFNMMTEEEKYEQELKELEHLNDPDPFPYDKFMSLFKLFG